MERDLMQYVDRIEKNIEAHFSVAGRREQMHQRIISQNSKYGYSTSPESEWFTGNNKLVVMIHSRKKKRPIAMKPHNHDFFEMNYVYKGKFYNEIENCKIEQGENSLVLLSPQTKHMCWTVDSSSIIFNFLIKRSVVEEIFLQMFSEKASVFRFFLDALYNVRDRQPYLSFKCDDIIYNILADIIKESTECELCYMNIMVAKLIELFSKLSRVYNQEKQNKPDSDQALQYQIYEYIENHYSSVTLSELANNFNYSSSYVSQLIKQHFNKSFSDILHDLRLKHSCHYLTHSDLPINNIVEIVGYKDLSHFYKIFNKRYGSAPNQYRKKHQLLNE